MSQRPDQVASLIRRAVQSALAHGLQDPRIRGLISVTKVDVASDLADATVFVSVLPAEHAPTTVRGLQNAAGRIRGRLGRAARLRRLPKLTFRVDESIKKQAALEAALREDGEAAAEEQER